MPRRSTGRGRRYGEGASRKVEKAMHERKQGSLRSGRSGRKVKSRAQAIAIGLSEARREGDKVPSRGSRRRSRSARPAGRGRSRSRSRTSARSRSRRSSSGGSRRRRSGSRARG